MIKSILQQEYENICEIYVKQFCKKQGLNYLHCVWLGDLVGGILAVGQNGHGIYFMDIVLDINSKQPKGLIFEWQEENSTYPEFSINYFSYTKGIRIKDTLITN